MSALTPETCIKMRVARGLSQAALSRLANVSSNYVSRFEGKTIPSPGYDKIRRIQEALERTPIPEETVVQVLEQLEVGENDQGFPNEQGRTNG